MSKKKGLLNISDNKFLNNFVQVLMAIIILLNVANVIVRYIFGISLNWSGELTRFVFVWVSFIAGSLIVSREEHLGIGDTFLDKLPIKVKNIIKIIQNILAGIFVILLIKYGFNMSNILMVRTSTVLGIKMGYVISIMYISGIFFLIHLLDNTIKAFNNIKNANKE